MRFWFRRDKSKSEPAEAPKVPDGAAAASGPAKSFLSSLNPFARKAEPEPPPPLPTPPPPPAAAPPSSTPAVGAPAPPPRAPAPPPQARAPEPPAPPTVPPASDEAALEAEQKRGFFARIKESLSKTKQVLNTPIEDLIRRTVKVSAETLTEIEELLLAADFGVETTTAIVDAAKKKMKRGELDTGAQLRSLICSEILAILEVAERERKDRQGGAPHIVLVVGVNGNGKTTTIGKLSKAYRSEGATVMLAAADTFRAAAIEQLQVWGKRADVPVIARASGSDPAAVVFDAIRESKKLGTTILVVDTAGRLQTKQPLMAELQKVSKVCGREEPGAPHEVLLVIDATTGQNGVAQAREFAKAVPVTGIVLSKLDGTAKGGIVVAIAREFKIPIRYVGVGEKIDDLVPFDPQDFVRSLFPE
ncbi:MAG: signal recognition particle-docking protein FtsY [Acidobacteriota bacterium]